MTNIKNLILGLLTIAGLIWLFVWGLSKISTDWLPFIAAGTGFLASRLYESWKENKTRLYDKKRDVYARLLYPWQSILIGNIAKKDKNKSDNSLSPELIKQAATAAFDAILYASDDVIRDYGNFRTVTAEGKVTTEIMLGRLTKLFKSIRKDLGNTYSNLTDVEILQMFMNLTPEEKKKFQNISRNLR